MSDVSPDNSSLAGLIEAAAEAAVQRSLSTTVVPVIRHGTVRQMNPYQWIHKVQMDGETDTIDAHDVTTTGVFTDARVTVLFAPPHQAMIIGVVQPGWKTYEVSWTGPLGSNPAIGDGVLQGAYKRDGQTCDIHIVMAFGSTTNGGTEVWRFSLPFVSASDNSEQTLLCKAFTNGADPHWVGFGTIPVNSQYVDPFLPKHALTSGLDWIRNADGSAAAGTGRPQVAGQYTWTNGKSLVLTGQYKTVP